MRIRHLDNHVILVTIATLFICFSLILASPLHKHGTLRASRSVVSADEEFTSDNDDVTLDDRDAVLVRRKGDLVTSEDQDENPADEESDDTVHRNGGRISRLVSQDYDVLNETPFDTENDEPSIDKRDTRRAVDPKSPLIKETYPESIAIATLPENVKTRLLTSIFNTLSTPERNLIYQNSLQSNGSSKSLKYRLPNRILSRLNHARFYNSSDLWAVESAGLLNRYGNATERNLYGDNSTNLASSISTAGKDSNIVRPGKTSLQQQLTKRPHRLLLTRTADRAYLPPQVRRSTRKLSDNVPIPLLRLLSFDPSDDESFTDDDVDDDVDNDVDDDVDDDVDNDIDDDADDDVDNDNDVDEDDAPFFVHREYVEEPANDVRDSRYYLDPYWSELESDSRNDGGPADQYRFKARSRREASAKIEPPTSEISTVYSGATNGAINPESFGETSSADDIFEKSENIESQNEIVNRRSDINNDKIDRENKVLEDVKKIIEGIDKKDASDESNDSEKPSDSSPNDKESQLTEPDQISFDNEEEATLNKKLGNFLKSDVQKDDGNGPNDQSANEDTIQDDKNEEKTDNKESSTEEDEDDDEDDDKDGNDDDKDDDDNEDDNDDKDDNDDDISVKNNQDIDDDEAKDNENNEKDNDKDSDNDTRKDNDDNTEKSSKDDTDISDDNNEKNSDQDENGVQDSGDDLNDKKNDDNNDDTNNDNKVNVDSDNNNDDNDKNDNNNDEDIDDDDNDKNDNNDNNDDEDIDDDDDDEDDEDDDDKEKDPNDGDFEDKDNVDNNNNDNDSDQSAGEDNENDTKNDNNQTTDDKDVDDDDNDDNDNDSEEEKDNNNSDSNSSKTSDVKSESFEDDKDDKADDDNEKSDDDSNKSDDDNVDEDDDENDTNNDSIKNDTDKNDGRDDNDNDNDNDNEDDNEDDEDEAEAEESLDLVKRLLDDVDEDDDDVIEKQTSDDVMSKDDSASLNALLATLANPSNQITADIGKPMLQDVQSVPVPSPLSNPSADPSRPLTVYDVGNVPVIQGNPQLVRKKRSNEKANPKKKGEKRVKKQQKNRKAGSKKPKNSKKKRKNKKPRRKQPRKNKNKAKKQNKGKPAKNRKRKLVNKKVSKKGPNKQQVKKAADKAAKKAALNVVRDAASQAVKQAKQTAKQSGQNVEQVLNKNIASKRAEVQKKAKEAAKKAAKRTIKKLKQKSKKLIKNNAGKSKNVKKPKPRSSQKKNPRKQNKNKNVGKKKNPKNSKRKNLKKKVKSRKNQLNKNRKTKPKKKAPGKSLLLKAKKPNRKNGRNPLQKRKKSKKGPRKNNKKKSNKRRPKKLNRKQRRKKLNTILKSNLRKDNKAKKRLKSGQNRLGPKKNHQQSTKSISKPSKNRPKSRKNKPKQRKNRPKQRKNNSKLRKGRPKSKKNRQKLKKNQRKNRLKLRKNRLNSGKNRSKAKKIRLKSTKNPQKLKKNRPKAKKKRPKSIKNRPKPKKNRPKPRKNRVNQRKNRKNSKRKWNKKGRLRVGKNRRKKKPGKKRLKTRPNPPGRKRPKGKKKTSNRARKLTEKKRKQKMQTRRRNKQKAKTKELTDAIIKTLKTDKKETSLPTNEKSVNGDTSNSVNEPGPSTTASTGAEQNAGSRNGKSRDHVVSSHINGSRMVVNLKGPHKLDQLHLNIDVRNGSVNGDQTVNQITDEEDNDISQIPGLSINLPSRVGGPKVGGADLVDEDDVTDGSRHVKLLLPSTEAAVSPSDSDNADEDSDENDLSIKLGIGLPDSAHLRSTTTPQPQPQHSPTTVLPLPVGDSASGGDDSSLGLSINMGLPRDSGADTTGDDDDDADKPETGGKDDSGESILAVGGLGNALKNSASAQTSGEARAAGEEEEEEEEDGNKEDGASQVDIGLPTERLRPPKRMSTGLLPDTVNQYLSEVSTDNASAQANTSSEGAWLEWGDWSECQRDDCARRDGYSERMRVCADGGTMSACHGVWYQRRLCDYNTLCAGARVRSLGQWGAWAAWTDCDVTCGPIGTRTRIRSCHVPLNVTKTSADVHCHGVWYKKHTCTPKLAVCPPTEKSKEAEKVSTSTMVSDASGLPSTISHPWTPWSACSVTCGVGMETRTRQCKQSGCAGADDSEKRHCVRNSCNPADRNAAVAAIRGRGAHLKCLVESVPNSYLVAWIDPHGHRITAKTHNSLYEIRGDYLYIKHVDPSMAGAYHCVVSTDSGDKLTADASLVIRTCALDNPCVHGRCVESGPTVDSPYHHFTCQCDAGYSGSRCDKNVALQIGIVCAVVFVCLIIFISSAWCIYKIIRRSKDTSKKNPPHAKKEEEYKYAPVEQEDPIPLDRLTGVGSERFPVDDLERDIERMMSRPTSDPSSSSKSNNSSHLTNLAPGSDDVTSVAGQHEYTNMQRAGYGYPPSNGYPRSNGYPPSNSSTAARASPPSDANNSNRASFLQRWSLGGGGGIASVVAKRRRAVERRRQVSRLHREQLAPMLGCDALATDELVLFSRDEPTRELLAGCGAADGGDGDEINVTPPPSRVTPHLRDTTRPRDTTQLRDTTRPLRYYSIDSDSDVTSDAVTSSNDHQSWMTDGHAACESQSTEACVNRAELGADMDTTSHGDCAIRNSTTLTSTPLINDSTTNIDSSTEQVDLQNTQVDSPTKPVNSLMKKFDSPTKIVNTPTKKFDSPTTPVNSPHTRVESEHLQGDSPSHCYPSSKPSTAASSQSLQRHTIGRSRDAVPRDSHKHLTLRKQLDRNDFIPSLSDVTAGLSRASVRELLPEQPDARD